MALICSYSADAKAKMEPKSKVAKSLTVNAELDSLDENTVYEGNLEPLTDKTVYYEDFNAGPRTNKKWVFESSITAIILLMSYY